VLADMARRALPGGAAGPVAAIPAQVTEIGAFDDEPVWEPADYDYNGDDEDAEPEPKPDDDATVSGQVADTPVNGNSNGKSQRPLSADKVIARMAEKVAGDDGEMATQAQKGLVASKARECFADTEDPDVHYHAVLQGLWSVDSTKNLTKRQASAMLDWLLLDGKKDDSGDYPLHPAAPEEARRIANRVMLEQMELFADPEGQEGDHLD
jgi:hypothetical protein